MQTARANYKPFSGQAAFSIEGLAEDKTVFQLIHDSQAWEPHVIAVLERIIRPDFVCLDVGANIGAITLPLARLASEGYVYAFEASPTAWELLNRNVVSNGLENVTSVNAAITDRTGEMTEIFTEGSQLGCAHLSSNPGRIIGTPEQVRTLALDYYGLKRVDLIKMDVEGGEVAALAGSRRLIQEHRPALVIEYNPLPAEVFAGDSRRALYDVLTELYPRIEIIGTDGALEPVPGWAYLDLQLTVHTWRDLLCTH